MKSDSRRFRPQRRSSSRGRPRVRRPAEAYEKALARLLRSVVMVRPPQQEIEPTELTYTTDRAASQVSAYGTVRYRLCTFPRQRRP